MANPYAIAGVHPQARSMTPRHGSPAWRAAEGMMHDRGNGPDRTSRSVDDIGARQIRRLGRETPMNTQAPHQTIQRCPLCGADLTASGDACTRCDWVPGYGQVQLSKTKERRPRDIAAVVLSVVPGAGHVFKGYLWPGVAIAVVGLPVVFILAAALHVMIGWMVPLIFWPAVMLDAYFRRDLHPHGPGARDSSRR